MIIERANSSDVAEILALQKLAYWSEGELYNDYTIPPLTQTLEEAEEEFARQTVLKAVEDGRIIGSVRAYMTQTTCHIGRFMVHPDAQNRGIGTQLMRAIEETFSVANRYELFTGLRSERNLYLYRKLGYKEFRRKVIDSGVDLIYLERVKS